MTPSQYNELMRQAEVLEKDKQYREFQELWEQFRIANPNTVGGFEEQFKSFKWLYDILVTKKETWEEIEEEYLKDEYPVFGGPFTDALKPFEWLKLWYHSPNRKDNEK